MSGSSMSSIIFHFGEKSLLERVKNKTLDKQGKHCLVWTKQTEAGGGFKPPADGLSIRIRL
jgi:hypothetical protein